MNKIPIEIKLYTFLKRLFSLSPDKKLYITSRSVPPTVTTRELNYRILHAQNNTGIVNWKNYTGNYVEKDELICNIVNQSGNSVPIFAPVRGIIANRFIEEGMNASPTSLLCLIKISERPRSLHGDLDKYKLLFKEKLDKVLPTDLSVDHRHVQTKIFVPVKYEEGVLEQSLEEDLFDIEPLDSYTQLFVDMLDKRRKEQYKKYLPEQIKEEEEMMIEETSQEETINKLNRGDFQDIVDENFSKDLEINLKIINEGIKNRYLVATSEIDMGNLIYNIMRKEERNDLKLEVKCCVIKAAIEAIYELPNFMNEKEIETKNINFRVGIIGGTNLGFPLLTNVNAYTYPQLIERLMILEKELLDSDLVHHNEKHDETLAICNDWDYGSIIGPSCLYMSNRTTLALNKIITKPVQISGNQINFRPIMSVTVTFNNSSVTGQDVLLFLNKIKKIFEDPISNFN